MCLASTRKEPSIAAKDIDCYKILITVRGNLITPYREFTFPLGVVMNDTAIDNSKEMFGVLVVESGYFHSYETLEAAKKELARIARKINYTPRIYKSVISKGTEFYEGQFSDICSKSLKIVEECFD